MTAPRDNLRRLMELAREPSSEKRRELLQQVTDLFLDDGAPLNQTELDLGVDIVARLAGQMEQEIRRNLAERLADSPNAPHRLATQLANDEIDVARPLLERGSVLSDADLVAIVQQASQEHLLAISGRQSVSTALSDALVERGDDRVLVSLVGNQGAELSAQAMDVVVQRSEQVEALLAPLAERKDLPPELMHQMLFWVTGAIRQKLMARRDIDESMLDGLLQNAKARFQADLQRPEDGLSAAERTVRRAARLNQLNAVFLLGALRGGRREEFLVGFAQLAELDMRTARRIIAAPGHEALAIACRALDFDANMFSSIALLTHAKGAQNVRSGGEFTQLIDIYRGVPLDAARRAMRFWRVRAQSAAPGATAVAAE
jgi:uncharacterized protein (DUF2336 family)